MESFSFQSQLLSVMEVLAKAAVAEINRRVDDSCAVLRMEVSQSRQDIDLLKSKCEILEAELRRSRIRARRKVCNSSDETFSTSAKTNNKGNQSSDWDRQSPNLLNESEDVRLANEAQHMQIKQECAEDEQISGAEELACYSAGETSHTDGFLENYSSSSNPALPESPAPPADEIFPEQLHENQSEAEHEVKSENGEGLDEKRSPHVSVLAQLWSTNLCGDSNDPDVSYTEAPIEQIAAAYGSGSCPASEVMSPRVHTAGRGASTLLSAARAKRRARSFAFKRLQTDDVHNASSQINLLASNSTSEQPHHHYSNVVPQQGNPNEERTQPSSTFFSSGQTRGSLVLTKRMRTQWRSGLCEKRFSCIYCNKTFMRFSQLKEHLRSHTGEKPFSCMQCGRSFTKQCNLIRHAVVHSGEKPFQCSLCGKCFTQRSSLTSHQKTLH